MIDETKYPRNLALEASLLREVRNWTGRQNLNHQDFMWKLSGTMNQEFSDSIRSLMDLNPGFIREEQDEIHEGFRVQGIQQGVYKTRPESIVEEFIEKLDKDKRSQTNRLAIITVIASHLPPHMKITPRLREKLIRFLYRQSKENPLGQYGVSPDIVMNTLRDRGILGEDEIQKFTKESQVLNLSSITIFSAFVIGIASFWK